MSRSRKLGANVIYMTVGNMASKFLSFLLIPLYTAVLTTSEYGIADIMTTTITLLAPVFTLQINEAVMRFCLDKDSDKKKILNVGVLIVAVGFVILLSIMPVVSILISADYFIVLFLLYYLTSTIYTLFSQYAKGIEKVKQYAFGGVLNTAITIVCNIIFLVFLKKGVVGYIASFILGNGLVSIYLIFVTKSYKDINYKYFDLKTAKLMVKYSAPMIPNSISWWITNSSDKYMITYILDTAANGIYSIAYKIPSLLSTVNSIFMSAWNISAVDDFGSKESKIFFGNVYNMISSMDTLIVTLLVFFAKPIASILYSKDFYVAWKIAIVLTLGFLFSSLSSFLGSIYTASKKTSALFYTSLFGAIVNIVLNTFLIPEIGTLGAAIATTCSYILVWLIRLIHTKKIFDFDKCILKNIFSEVILVLQIFITYKEEDYSWFCSGVCTIILLIINIKFLKYVLNNVFSLARSLLKNRI